MQKSQAIELLGGTVSRAADAIGINPQAISQWPDDLPPRLTDRVIAALVRQGRDIPLDLLPTSTPAEDAAAEEVSRG